MTYPVGSKKLLIIGGVVFVCVVLALAFWGGDGTDMTSGSEQDRIEAAARIAIERPAGARSKLTRALEDESPRVRQAALLGLAQIRIPEDRPIFEKATTDKDARVRAVAAESLGKFNDTEATVALKKIAESPEEDRAVRKAALRGLVPCDDPRAIVALIELAGDESAPADIRLQAAKSALRKAGGRLRKDRRPENAILWRDLIQRLKNDQRIRRAYQVAGVRLVDKPGDIATPSLHGARELPTGPGDPLAPGLLVEKNPDDEKDSEE